MAYRKKRTQSKYANKSYKYHTLRTPGKKGITRGKNMKETTDQQRGVNQKISAENRIFKFCNNIEPGDLWVTLTYRQDNRPEDEEQAHNNFKKFIRHIRDAEKKQGVSILYMGNTELGSRGGLHHHIAIRKETGLIELINQYWTCGAIRIDKVEHKDRNRNIYKLACYFAKSQEGTVKKKFTASRNLIPPEVIIEEVESGTWQRNPRQRKREILVESNKGYTEEGYEYQEDIYISLDIPKRKPPQRKRRKNKKKKNRSRRKR